MTKLILIHKINKFYHIFWEVLDYSFEPHISNFDNDFLLQVLYDIDEALDGYDDDMTKWLYKLKLQILNHRSAKYDFLDIIAGVVLFAINSWITYTLFSMIWG